MSLSKALRAYKDPTEAVADTSARIIKRYTGSRRVKVVPKGQGFTVLLDGDPIASIDAQNNDEAAIREKVDTALCR